MDSSRYGSHWCSLSARSSSRSDWEEATVTKHLRQKETIVPSALRRWTKAEWLDNTVGCSGIWGITVFAVELRSYFPTKFGLVARARIDDFDGMMITLSSIKVVDCWRFRWDESEIRMESKYGFDIAENAAAHYSPSLKHLVSWSDGPIFYPEMCRPNPSQPPGLLAGSISFAPAF